jgi:hypothetical protein
VAVPRLVTGDLRSVPSWTYTPSINVSGQ